MRVLAQALALENHMCVCPATTLVVCPVQLVLALTMSFHALSSFAQSNHIMRLTNQSPE